MRKYIGLTLCLLIASCNYLDFSRKNKNTLVNKRIQEIKANGLELYPEITPCENLDGKQCFEKQLISEIKASLKESETLNQLKQKDTIWLTIHVSNKGLVSLSSISSEINRETKNTLIYTLEQLSPIKSATINGTPVNSNFKIPLILKTNS